jgi:TIR domain
MSVDQRDGDRFDVMISYARENGPAVRQMLYERLCRCRNREGGRARIFLDEGRPDGVPPGQGFHGVLAAAIQRSDAVVMVYSRAYFESPMCRWEWNLALNAATSRGSRMALMPVLLEPVKPESIPFALSPFQILSTAEAGWFEALCDTIGLVPETTSLELRFQTQPVATTVGHTLPPVKVAVLSDGVLVGGDREEVVTIAAEQGALTGTRTRQTTQGVATFTDLSIATPEARTRLVAACPGAIQTFSEAFPVLVPAVSRQRDERHVGGRVARGSLRFVNDDHLAFILPDRLQILDDGLRLLGVGDITGTLKLVRCSASMVALATWEGLIHIGTTGGQVATVDLRAGRDGFMVPGDMVLRPAHHLHVGCWNGAVYRLAGGDDRPPDLVLEHPAGVQALGTLGSSLYVWGLDGRLCRYDDGRPVLWPPHRPVPVVRYLMAAERTLVGVGDRGLFRVDLESQEIYEEELPLGAVAWVLGDTEAPVVVDTEGRGVRFDHALKVRGGFQAVAGCRPTSADQNGDCCVLANPDGSHSLVVDGRVVLRRPGPLAVSPDGQRLALMDEDGQRIVALETELP